MKEAIREALEEEMIRDNEVFIIGEDVAEHGGCFGVTGDLCKKFPDRVIDSPIAELGIMGLSLGAAYSGMKAVPELMFADFISVIYDYLMNQATRNRYMTGMQEGGQDCCMVMRAPNGAGIRAGAQHSQCVEQYLMPIPGLKILTPATPADAKGMLKTALRGNDPVVFLEHKMLLGVKGPVPEDEDYLVPIGKADVKREGTDVTIIANQMMTVKALKAAQLLEKDGISVEVVDLRSVKPLDMDTILKSVKKTGKVVLTNESPSTGNIMSEISTRIVAGAFADLKAAPVKVCAPDTPIPFATNLEDAWLRNEKDLVAAVKELMA